MKVEGIKVDFIDTHLTGRVDNILIKYFALGILLSLAFVSDMRTYKIKNRIVLPFLIFGLLCNTFMSGIHGAVISITAVLLPILLLGVLYVLRMLGAGDIKLFCAIGALMGAEFVLYTIAFSFLTGGCIALFLIAIRKNAKKRFLHFFHYLKNSLLSFSLVPYTSKEQADKTGKFPFAAAIVCGSILQACFTLFRWSL